MKIAFTIWEPPIAQPRQQFTVRLRQSVRPVALAKMRIRDIMAAFMPVPMPPKVKDARTGKRTDHPVVSYKDRIRDAAREAYQGLPLEGPLRLDRVFVMPRPDNMMWKRKPMPRVLRPVKPDDDNLDKALKDALKGLLWVDDSQVCQGWMEKVTAAGDEPPHVEVALSRAILNEANEYGLGERPAQELLF